MSKSEERTEVTAALNRSEAKLRAILETAVEGIITIDRGGRIESVNSAACRMFGYTAEELLGENVKLLMPVPHRRKHDGYITRYLETGQRKIIGVGREVEGLRKNGERFPMYLSVGESWLEDDWYFTGIIRDITPEKKAEQRLRESEQQHRDLFYSTHDLVHSISPDGRFVFVNPAWKNALGYTDEEIPGLSLMDIIHPDSSPHCEQVFSDVMAGREVPHIEAFFVTKQGQLIEVEGSASPRIVDGKVIASHGFFRDVTHRRQSELRVLQAERLAAIGEVAAGVAHESRNALQRIQAHVEMLQMDFEDNPDVIYQLSRIGQAADHISELLTEVRSYAAPIKLERVECCLANVWRQAWDNLAELRIGRDATVVEQIADVVTQCRVDPFRLEQVFRNLIENSLAACQDPLSVTISCLAVYRKNRRWLVVSFRDSGPGLSEQQQRRVFEAFYTTKTKGSGLGMAIAKRIIEAHGGVLDVSMSDEPGAEFIIKIPCGKSA